MHVHIVCREWENDAILSRLARALAAEEGWSVGAEPNPNATINHFAAYIEYAERFSDFFATPTSAFFTHLETITPYKVFWWELAADRIGLRVTCAKMYERLLHPTGLSILARPAIDRATYRPLKEPRKRDLPTVGLSGFVDRRSGRKGERMVATLAGSALADKFDFVASGKGWPVKRIKRRKIEDMPAFYQGLDVYLCTALTEGIPMPPLEALACGIPIVIPTGVGMLDSLPDTPGVYRYEVGDYAGMEQAVEKAVCEPDAYDPEQLRALTEPFTVQNWVEDHKAGFDALLSLPARRKESDRHGKKGVYYVAFGKPARDCARGAMLSFREHMKGVEIALAADRPIGAEDVHIQVKDSDIGGRGAKVRIYDFAPEDWQYILYLDADTEVIKDVSWLYQPLLDGWDLVICKNPGKYHLARYMKRSDNEDECKFTFGVMGTDEILQLNGGVFAFQRNQRTAAFFECWNREWQRWGKRDQGALLRALWQCPLKMLVLTNHWNTIVRYTDNPESYTAGILHFPMTARRWRGIVQGRLDAPNAWSVVEAYAEKQGDA